LAKSAEEPKFKNTRPLRRGTVTLGVGDVGSGWALFEPREWSCLAGETKNRVSDRLSVPTLR